MENMDITDTLINYGGAIKALGPNDQGHEQFEGYLVKYGSPTEHDKSRFKDYFTKSTDFDIADGATSAVYYYHGLSKDFGRKKLSTGEMSFVGDGIKARWSMNPSDDRERKLVNDLKAGKMGLSSGVPAHLVERMEVKGANEVKLWPLGKDISITPTPADPRCMAYSLKSLINEIELEAEDIPEAVKTASQLDELNVGLLDGLKFADHSTKALAAEVEYKERFNDLILDRVADRIIKRDKTGAIKSQFGEDLNYPELAARVADALQSGGIKAGAVLSQGNYDRLDSICSQHESNVSSMRAFLNQYKPGSDDTILESPDLTDNTTLDVPETPLAVQKFRLLTAIDHARELVGPNKRMEGIPGIAGT